MTQILSGKRAICNFVGRGWATVEKLILQEGFPAKKIAGIWESTPELITEWRNSKIKSIENRGRESRMNKGKKIVKKKMRV